MTDRPRFIFDRLRELIQGSGLPKGAFADLVDIERHRFQGIWMGCVFPTEDEIEAIETVCAAMKEEEPSTLCHCSSCEAHRKEIRRGLLSFPTTIKEKAVEEWLNIKFEEMGKDCCNVRE